VTDVVTGEAVALDLRPARVPSRALALLVDVVAMGVLLIGVLVLVALAGDSFDPALAAALFLAVAVLVLVGWPTAWETLTRGRSPGKYAMGLRVVRDDGGPIRFRHAFTRALTGLVVDFGVLSGGTGVVAVVVSASSARGKRVGDLLAGTVVLRERVPREASATGALPATRVVLRVAVKGKPSFSVARSSSGLAPTTGAPPKVTPPPSSPVSASSALSEQPASASAASRAAQRARRGTGSRVLGAQVDHADRYHSGRLTGQSTSWTVPPPARPRTDMEA